MFMLLSSGPIYDIQIKTYSSPSKTLLMWKVQDSLKGRWGGKPQQEPLKGQFLLSLQARALSHSSSLSFIYTCGTTAAVVLCSKI